MTPTQNTSKLEDLLRPHQQEFNVLQEALVRISPLWYGVSEEDMETRKKSAKEMIRKALELKKQMDDAEKQFSSQKKKWDKELGKTLQRLQNMANNRPLEEGVKEEKEEQSEQSDQ